VTQLAEVCLCAAVLCLLSDADVVVAVRNFSFQFSLVTTVDGPLELGLWDVGGLVVVEPKLECVVCIEWAYCLCMDNHKPQECVTLRG